MWIYSSNSLLHLLSSNFQYFQSITVFHALIEGALCLTFTLSSTHQNWLCVSLTGWTAHGTHRETSVVVWTVRIVVPVLKTSKWNVWKWKNKTGPLPSPATISPLPAFKPRRLISACHHMWLVPHTCTSARCAASVWSASCRAAPCRKWAARTTERKMERIKRRQAPQEGDIDVNKGHGWCFLKCPTC